MRIGESIIVFWECVNLWLFHLVEMKVYFENIRIDDCAGAKDYFDGIDQLLCLHETFKKVISFNFINR